MRCCPVFYSFWSPHWTETHRKVYFACANMKLLSPKFILSGILLGVYLTPYCIANRRPTFGEPCNRNLRCDSRGSLTCKNGICECIKSDTMKYDAAYRRCSVLAGEKCIFTAVEGEKVEQRSWREEMPCVPSAQCQDGFCTCFHGFYETTNGTCAMKKAHREDCESSNACRDDQFLVCSDQGRCECNATISSFDFPRGVCVRLAGQSCTDVHLCVSHAQCRPPDFTELGELTCFCDEGFFANPEGACERKRGFGQPCLSNDYCLNEEYMRLGCTENGTCGCDTAISIFDPASNICRRRAGAICEGFPFCVDNAECGNEMSRFYGSSEAVCECLVDYFATDNGTCELRRPYGERCEKDTNCKQGLKCHPEKGLCQCDASKSVYDKVKGKCVGLANSVCDNTDNCITNSECLWGSIEDQRQCICRHGYAQSTNGSCLATYDVWCTADWTFACNHEQGLVCKDGKCGCKYDKFQRFDKGLQKCVSEVRGPCDESIPCVKNSKCSENENGVLKCQCTTGFVEVDGECQLGIGQPCNYTIRNEDFPKCDSVAPLSCIEGKCQCGPLQEYDHEIKKCRGKVGSFCNSEATEENNCIAGAQCVKRRSSLSTRGMCKCKTGFKTTKDGRCILVAGRAAEGPVKRTSSAI